MSPARGHTCPLSCSRSRSRRLRSREGALLAAPLPAAAAPSPGQVRPLRGALRAALRALTLSRRKPIGESLRARARGPLRSLPKPTSLLLIQKNYHSNQSESLRFLGWLVGDSLRLSLATNERPGAFPPRARSLHRHRIACRITQGRFPFRLPQRSRGTAPGRRAYIASRSNRSARSRASSRCLMVASRWSCDTATPAIVVIVVGELLNHSPEMVPVVVEVHPLEIKTRPPPRPRRRAQPAAGTLDEARARTPRTRRSSPPRAR